MKFFSYFSIKKSLGFTSLVLFVSMLSLPLKAMEDGTLKRPRESESAYSSLQKKRKITSEVSESIPSRVPHGYVPSSSSSSAMEGEEESDALSRENVENLFPITTGVREDIPIQDVIIAIPVNYLFNADQIARDPSRNLLQVPITTAIPINLIDVDSDSSNTSSNIQAKYREMGKLPMKDRVQKLTACYGRIRSIYSQDSIQDVQSVQKELKTLQSAHNSLERVLEKHPFFKSANSSAQSEEGVIGAVTEGTKQNVISYSALIQQNAAALLHEHDTLVSLAKNSVPKQSIIDQHTDKARNALLNMEVYKNVLREALETIHGQEVTEGMRQLIKRQPSTKKFQPAPTPAQLPIPSIHSPHVALLAARTQPPIASTAHVQFPSIVRSMPPVFAPSPTLLFPWAPQERPSRELESKFQELQQRQTNARVEKMLILLEREIEKEEKEVQELKKEKEKTGQ